MTNSDDEMIIEQNEEEYSFDEALNYPQAHDINDEIPIDDFDSFQQRNFDFIQQTQWNENNNGTEGFIENIGELLDPSELDEFEKEMSNFGILLRVLSNEKRILYIGLSFF